MNERWSSKWAAVTNSAIVSFLITNSVVWKGDLLTVVYSEGRHYFQHVALINFCLFSMYFCSNRAESWKQRHDYDTCKWFVEISNDAMDEKWVAVSSGILAFSWGSFFMFWGLLFLTCLLVIISCPGMFFNPFFHYHCRKQRVIVFIWRADLKTPFPDLKQSSADMQRLQHVQHMQHMQHMQHAWLCMHYACPLVSLHNKHLSLV